MLSKKLHAMRVEETEEYVAFLNLAYNKYPHNEQITYEYCYGLTQLTSMRFSDPFNDEWEESYARLKALVELHNDIENELYSFISKSALCVDYSTERLCKVLCLQVNDEKFAEVVSRALAYFTPQDINTDALIKINLRLERLNNKYPNNASIASDYAEGLFYFAEELRLRDITHERMLALERLTALAYKYPDDEVVNGWAGILKDEQILETLK
jgi:hypothetical protein